MVVEPKLSLKLVSFLVFGTTLSHILSLFNSHSPKRSFGKEAAEKKEAPRRGHESQILDNLDLNIRLKLFFHLGTCLAL